MTSCRPDLTVLLVCYQIYVECRLLPSSLRMFRFLGSFSTINRTIYALQRLQQATLRLVEVNVEDMYLIALEVLTGLRLVRVRHEIRISDKVMRKYETIIRFITKKDDLKFDWIHRRPQRA